MPTWLPGVLTSAVLFGASYLLLTGRLLERLENLSTDVSNMEAEKLDKNVHAEFKERIDGTMATLAHDLSKSDQRFIVLLEQSVQNGYGKHRTGEPR